MPVGLIYARDGLWWNRMHESQQNEAAPLLFLWCFIPEGSFAHTKDGNLFGVDFCKKIL